MVMEYILSQVFGFVALILVCIGYFVRSKASFLVFQIVADIFYATSYMLLGVFSAGAITIISTIRCVFLYFYEIKGLNYKNAFYTMFLFIGGYIACGIVFWKSWLDLIPIITGTLFTIAYYVRNLQLVRFLCLAPNVMLMIFGILTTNYSTAILDFLEFSVLVCAIIKFYLEEKKEVKNP